LEWEQEMRDALADFLRVSEIAGYKIRALDLTIESHPSPHIPPTHLPKKTMALYAFFGDGQWLKIGIAGEKSQARYVSQHYNAESARSNLAKSLRGDRLVRDRPDFTSMATGEWIRSNCHRMNVLLGAHHGRRMLALLESFLHVRLQPRYEQQTNNQDVVQA
jgi:hypothetical protein